ncbi:MAG: ATP-binding protein [Clostridiales bacterium]|nr:ATP-binding protein [Clostridiales bacterium]
MSDLSKAKLLLGSLTVYRSLLSDETVSRFLGLLSDAEGGDAASFCQAYAAFFKCLSEQSAALDFAAHLETLVRYDDNAFSRAAARGVDGAAYRLLKQAAQFDLEALSLAAGITASALKSDARLRADAAAAELIDPLPTFLSERALFRQDAASTVAELEAFYQKNGYGIFAAFGAFRWLGSLVGVPHPDPVRLSALKEYEYERGVVASNTLDFVEGRGGGNLLLYGDRGTGKSSTIKALGNEYRARGLRIVEVPKEHITDLPDILELLRNAPQRFILFLDDLTFSSDDAAFSALKSILEGGVIARPENCRVYATSNRRHLVKESFSERDVDDVHAGDTMQEKLALYDRFDQTVNFFAPDQARYLAIVRALAEECKLMATQDALERGAVQWAIRAGGRSPRTAKQYVEWAASRLQKGEAILD